MNRAIHTVFGLTAMIMAAFAITSCEHLDDDNSEYDKVMILCSAGFNSLSSYLSEDIEELQTGYIPANNSGNALFVISKLPVSSGNYSEETAPCLFRIYGNGTKVTLDTLMTMEKGAVLAEKGNIRTFLEYVRDNFPSKSYGLVVSSHATGWLPSGYFSNPDKYETSSTAITSNSIRAGSPAGLPLYVEPERDPSLPAVKTITQEIEVIDGVRYSHEIEIEDFADAIPMHLDYLLLDVCLMGGVEVAYAYKDIADVIGFSPTEVLAEGYDYSTIASHLLAGSSPDPQAVCEDFFEYYNSLSGTNRSATITLVDCSKVDALADVCQTLFGKYRDVICSMDPSPVQAYFYSSKYHWHYDLYDIVAKAGASENELATLQAALDDCILYKNATPSFFNLELNTVSGLSMYLPSDGSDYLDNFYRSLSWNEATGLVSE